MLTMDEIVDGFLSESEIDFIALPQLVNAARQCLGAHSMDQMRKLTLEMVKRLYKKGLRPGDYDLGSRFDYWPDEGCQTMLDRIEREWIEANEEPNLAEPICWFARARREA